MFGAIFSHFGGHFSAISGRGPFATFFPMKALNSLISGSRPSWPFFPSDYQRKSTSLTFFYPCRTPTIPGKEGKNAQKNKEFLAGEKTRNSKKTRKGRTGTRLGRPHCKSLKFLWEVLTLLSVVNMWATSFTLQASYSGVAPALRARWPSTEFSLQFSKKQGKEGQGLSPRSGQNLVYWGVFFQGQQSYKAKQRVH